MLRPAARRTNSAPTTHDSARTQETALATATKLVIVGLPSSGKTTVFNALTRAEAQTGTFGASDGEPNLATVKVPDPRLDLLTEMFKPQRKVPADVQYL